MGKVTVKHYLNVNLKPYIINGEKYYSIYMLVTSNRQNTKVKSHAFGEYYSEKDFQEIMNSTDEDHQMLVEEEGTVINIVQLLNNEIQKFDTSLFAAVYNYYPSIYVLDLELDLIPVIEGDSKKRVNLYCEDQNKLGIDISTFFTSSFSLQENESSGMSLYSYFSPTVQSRLSDYLDSVNVKIEKAKAIEFINQIVMYQSFEKLRWILMGNNKFSPLLEKYFSFFEPTDSFGWLYNSL